MTAATLILVNYNTAADTLAAVAALLAESPPPRLVVVDNASRPEERRRLEALPTAVRVVWNDTNLGYGGALNRALALADTPVVGFLNPDTVPFPGALATLLGTLEADARVAAVAPRLWWDETRTLLLPPVSLPTLGDFLARGVGRRVAGFGDWYSQRLGRWAFRIGYADRTTHLPMLSGAFLLARRRVVDEVGGFDPGFQLYLEDADWCRRVGRAGHRLAYVPAADVVHRFDQSAQQLGGQAEAWRAGSLRHYLRKYYGPAGPALVAGVERAMAGGAAPPTLPVTDLGVCEAPPRIAPPAEAGVLQVAYDGRFYDAALGRVAGAPWRFPDAVWMRLRPRRYFARALHRASWRPLALWSWEKRAPAPMPGDGPAERGA